MRETAFTRYLSDKLLDRSAVFSRLECEAALHQLVSPDPIDTPPVGTALKCLICAFDKPWGIFDTKTGATVCEECKRKAQPTRATPEAPCQVCVELHKLHAGPKRKLKLSNIVSDATMPTEPPCWHTHVDDDGFCMACNNRVAIELSEPTAEPASASGEHDCVWKKATFAMRDILDAVLPSASAPPSANVDADKLRAQRDLWIERASLLQHDLDDTRKELSDAREVRILENLSKKEVKRCWKCKGHGKTFCDEPGCHWASCITCDACNGSGEGAALPGAAERGTN